jgi:hypothetical protein
MCVWDSLDGSPRAPSLILAFVKGIYSVFSWRPNFGCAHEILTMPIQMCTNSAPNLWRANQPSKYNLARPLLHGIYKKLGKFGSIPLKDHHFGSIPLLSHLHVGPHESMTCGVHGIYLKFGSFNGIDPIVPKSYASTPSILSLLPPSPHCRRSTAPSSLSTSVVTPHLEPCLFQLLFTRSYRRLPDDQLFSPFL